MSPGPRIGSPLERARSAVGGLGDTVRDWWAQASRWQRWVVYLLLLLLAIAAPSPVIGSFMSPYTDWTSLLFNPIGTYILLAIGLNIVVGHAGLLDLGYVAFFAIGAYTLAYLGVKHGCAVTILPSSPWASARSSGSPRSTPTRSAGPGG